jgi:hypothetical protein
MVVIARIEEGVRRLLLLEKTVLDAKARVFVYSRRVERLLDGGW